jgi:hypothetical protein
MKYCAPLSYSAAWQTGSEQRSHRYFSWFNPVTLKVYIYFYATLKNVLENQFFVTILNQATGSHIKNAGSLFYNYLSCLALLFYVFSLYFKPHSLCYNFGISQFR